MGGPSGYAQAPNLFVSPETKSKEPPMCGFTDLIPFATTHEPRQPSREIIGDQSLGIINCYVRILRCQQRRPMSL